MVLQLSQRTRAEMLAMTQATHDQGWGLNPRGGGGVLLCAAQRGRDFEVPGLERGIHFRGVF